jgi:hypothetical protein
MFCYKARHLDGLEIGREVGEFNWRGIEEGVEGG